MNERPSNGTPHPYLQMKGIRKRFTANGVLANDGVDLEVMAGEIHALVGENGAGKTTLMRILDGLEQADEGDILLDGKKVTVHSPRDALRLGIGMVPQQFRLIPDFTVAENIVLGSEPRKGGLLFDGRSAAKKVEALLKTYGFDLEPDVPVNKLSIGQMQQTEILRVLHRNAELLVLDEPTAVLAQQQIDMLFSTLKKLVSAGKTVVFITHKLREVRAVSDRVTVMRGGKSVAVRKTRDISEDELARLMMGRNTIQPAERKPLVPGKNVYTMKHVTLSRRGGEIPVLDDICLEVRSGEIHGVTGISGSGLGDLEDVISGLCTGEGYRLYGEITHDGEEVSRLLPEELRRRDIAFVPSNRLFRGVCLTASGKENMILGHTREVTHLGFFSEKAIQDFIRPLAERFQLPRRLDDPVGLLSGGNIQKVVLARELAAPKDFILFSEPSWGLDFATTAFLHREILGLRESGSGILLITTDLDEALTLSDRLSVMYGGKIVKELRNTGEVSRQAIGAYRLGGGESELEH